MKTVKEFTEAMKSEEMQEAFNKYIEGKECDTAEKAEKLVRDFALENGFELPEGTVSTMAPEDLSEEALANVAGGLLYSAHRPNDKVTLGNDQDNRTHVFNDRLGLVINDDNLGLFFARSNDNAQFARSDDNVTLARPNDGPDGVRIV